MTDWTPAQELAYARGNANAYNMQLEISFRTFRLAFLEFQEGAAAAILEHFKSL